MQAVCVRYADVVRTLDFGLDLEEFHHCRRCIGVSTSAEAFVPPTATLDLDLDLVVQHHCTPYKGVSAGSTPRPSLAWYHGRARWQIGHILLTNPVFYIYLVR